jgi:hypothetical protein
MQICDFEIVKFFFFWTVYIRRGQTEESQRKLLVSAIRDYLKEREIQIKPNEDIVRFFFRFHASIIITFNEYIYIYI